MQRNDYFIQNENDDIFSPIDENLIRLKLSELNPNDGSFFVLQNKLKVGDFFQCVASDDNYFLCEVKHNDTLYQNQTVHSLPEVICLIDTYLKDELKINNSWKKIIL
ncbi:MAG: hypothetical protein KC646_04310 [Candidatus Cloacimonetes bacterium]|nr:hypothetical protein [Candidatus Cloacimonadota bacterium]